MRLSFPLKDRGKRDTRVALWAQVGTRQKLGRLAALALGVQALAVSCTAPWLDDGGPATGGAGSGGAGAGGTPGGDCDPPVICDTFPPICPYYCGDLELDELPDECQWDINPHIPVDCPTGCARDVANNASQICSIPGPGGLGGGGGLGGAAGAAGAGT